MAFHPNGKPRGWFRAIALKKPDGQLRPLFWRAFYKKNGSLRPDFASYHRTSAQNSILRSSDPEDIARTIFAEQQSEMTSAMAEEIIATLGHRPLISIIMPVYNTPTEWLHRAIVSIQSQLYTNWELCVVDDCSTVDGPWQLLTDLAKEDPRIRVARMDINGGISKASNVGLDMAQGEFTALVDHDDEITPDALLRMVEAINSEPETDFLYSDECKICDTPARRLFHFVFKPDWSPEIMFNFMITGHLTVYRTELMREIGGFRSAFDFSQDYDLALRMSEVSRRVIHVERVLYLWRAINGSAASGGKDFARETNVAALGDALVRRKIPGVAKIEPQANRVWIDLPTTDTRVSIIIPSDSAKNIRIALDAIRNGTDYPNYEVCVVCNGRVLNELTRDYADWGAVDFVKYDKPYNFSDKCNVGAEAATGDIVVFYNDDVFPIGRDWVERLIEYLLVPGVGAVSPQLLYENGTIQYAGMISGTPGLAGTAYHGLPLGHIDQFLSMNRLVRNISILSGACCAMRRSLFLALGGFDSVNTPDGHSDLDLSFKIREAGLRCVYTPYSLLTHVGNHSWNTKDRITKADIFCLKRWGEFISTDPYFTRSMCRVLYKDFTFNYRIHAKGIAAQNTKGRDVLFVSHDLSNTGAPHMLLEAVRAVKAAGDFPVVISPLDGPLRTAFENEGVAVIIDASLNDGHFLFERFARNFDVVVVNTCTLCTVVEQLSAREFPKTIWWLHESQMLPAYLERVSEAALKNTIIYCVGSYAKSFLPLGVESKTIFNGLPDPANRVLPPAILETENKLSFLLLGTIEPRKGQDVFIDAIMGLPEDILSSSQFIFAGKVYPHNKTFWDKVSAKVESSPEISYLGDVSHDMALALVKACDVLVASSRDDSFSLVSIEAAAFSKPMILSDHVGAIEVFDESCAFVFRSGAVDGLRDCIVKAHSQRSRLLAMGAKARLVYDAKLSDTVFKENFIKLIDMAANDR